MPELKNLDPQIVYLSGPMRGIAWYNHAEFNRVAAAIREQGYVVSNPCDNFGSITDLPRKIYMRRDVTTVLEADVVAVLPGWRSSNGAKMEVIVAQELGLPVVDAEILTTGDWVEIDDLVVTAVVKPKHAVSVLEEARNLVDGPRQKDYGHPHDNDSAIALTWTALLRKAGVIGKDQEFPVWLVWMFMACVKLCRQAHNRKRDNLVDLAGYARTGEMVENREGTF